MLCRRRREPRHWVYQLTNTDVCGPHRVYFVVKGNRWTSSDYLGPFCQSLGGMLRWVGLAGESRLCGSLGDKPSNGSTAFVMRERQRKEIKWRNKENGSCDVYIQKCQLLIQIAHSCCCSMSMKFTFKYPPRSFALDALSTISSILQRQPIPPPPRHDDPRSS